MSQGYLYHQGKLISIAETHTLAIGDVTMAIKNGMVRIRDHGNVVAFQGRSKLIVETALQQFLDIVRIPSRIAIEYPGHYSETTVRE